MYFDLKSFSQSLAGYTKPLLENLRDIIYEIPEVLKKIKTGTVEFWTKDPPKSLGGLLANMLLAIVLLLPLVVMFVFTAFKTFEHDSDPGWLIVGFFLLLYALSIPIAAVVIALFNIKFGEPESSQA